MRILVFGNPLVGIDSVPLQILPKLQKQFPNIDFVEFDAVEDLEKEGNDLVILDAVDGISTCQVLTDIHLFEKTNRNMSMHDFDLRQSLQLLHALGTVEKVRVIGIPIHYSKTDALNETIPIIETMCK